MTPQVLFDATALGFEYSLLAVGIYITFRILNMADLTVDGSFCLGMAVSAIFTVQGMPVVGLIMGAIAGALAGVVTGILATKGRINPLIAGIITSTGLYSINIFVLGSPNISLLGVGKAYDMVHSVIAPGQPGSASPAVAPVGGGIAQLDISKFLFVIIIVAIIITILIAYFKTESGLAMRAVGDNEEMSAASSINVDAVKIGGLALGNALVGLTGGLLAQAQGFADMSSGTGMVMVGLACVIIGEVFGGKKSVTSGLICSVLGSVVYRLIIQFALTVNLFDANALKLISAIIVAVFMGVPALRAYMSERKKRANAMSANKVPVPSQKKSEVK
jgi:putative tryptophan/tyrosine transport system permease protein